MESGKLETPAAVITHNFQDKRSNAFVDLLSMPAS
jgi:hypothetical protein